MEQYNRHETAETHELTIRVLNDHFSIAGRFDGEMARRFWEKLSEKNNKNFVDILICTSTKTAKKNLFEHSILAHYSAFFTQ